MHQKYIQLFKEITHATETLAYQVEEFNRSNNDEKGEKTAQTMKNDFHQLYDKINSEQFDPATLTKGDYARLLVGVLIIVNNLETRIKAEQDAVKNYKEQIITKLERVVNECDTDEAAKNLANELFIIENNN